MLLLNRMFSFGGINFAPFKRTASIPCGSFKNAMAAKFSTNTFRGFETTTEILADTGFCATYAIS
jgi:hypothetical protein